MVRKEEKKQSGVPKRRDWPKLPNAAKTFLRQRLTALITLATVGPRVSGGGTVMSWYS